jgi:phenylalanyl-tRNA synthetase beta chain
VSSLLKSSLRQTPDVKAAEAAWAEQGQAVRLLVDGADAGCLGVVRRAIAEEWRIYEPVVVAEFDSSILTRAPNREPVSAPPAYPAVQRDNAFVIDKTVRDAEIQAVIRRVAPTELESLLLFDVFEGKALGAGKKSLAYSFTYRRRDRTLTEEEVERLHAAIVEAIARETGAVVRAG